MVAKRIFKQMEMLVKKVNAKLTKVSPAYTSVDAFGLSLTKRIDIHTASAYIIALKGLRRRRCNAPQCGHLPRISLKGHSGLLFKLEKDADAFKCFECFNLCYSP